MKRYLQQMVVPELGAKGQEKLNAAKVLVIGAGGLGTPLATYLAAAGVGTIGIADGDTVAETNLARQFLFNINEIGIHKVNVLVEKLAIQNPLIQVIPLAVMINEENAGSLISQYDIVCDCSDNAETRILLDLVCGQLQKPLVYAVVKDWEAYVTVLHHKKKISLENIFSHESLRQNAELNCSTAGIINSTCGFAGTLQATEVFKIILGIDSGLDGAILCFNGMIPSFRIFSLQR